MEKDKAKLPSKVKWMQRFFSIAGNIAPATAISILVNLVFTPQKRVLRPPHKELLNKGQKSIIKVSEFREPKKKLKMKYYTWGKGEKTVLLIHGWDAMALDFYKVIPPLVEAGYKVIAIDGPAHGGSEGSTTSLLHFKKVLAEFIEKNGVPYAMVGHSMGGGASAYLLMEYPIEIKRLIMVAIPISSKRFFDEVFSMLKVPNKMKQLFFKGMQEQFNENIDRLNLSTRNEVIKAEKIMLLYDEDDEVVSYKDILQFLATRPEIQSFNAKGTGQNNIIRSKKVIDEILAFLN